MKQVSLTWDYDLAHYHFNTKLLSLAWCRARETCKRFEIFVVWEHYRVKIVREIFFCRFIQVAWYQKKGFVTFFKWRITVRDCGRIYFSNSDLREFISFTKTIFSTGWGWVPCTLLAQNQYARRWVTQNSVLGESGQIFRKAIRGRYFSRVKQLLAVALGHITKVITEVLSMWSCMHATPSFGSKASDMRR